MTRKNSNKIPAKGYRYKPFGKEVFWGQRKYGHHKKILPNTWSVGKESSVVLLI